MLTRKEVDGAKTVGARLAAEGFHGPDLRMGNVDIARSVSRRISLGGLEEMATLEPGF